MFLFTLDPKQHQATYCLIEQTSDASFVLKALKQKLYVDNLAYLLQDIYGIENKLVHQRVRFVNNVLRSECHLCRRNRKTMLTEKKRAPLLANATSTRTTKGAESA